MSNVGEDLVDDGGVGDITNDAQCSAAERAYGDKDRKYKRSFDDETKVSPCVKVARFWLEMKLPEFWGHRRRQKGGASPILGGRVTCCLGRIPRNSGSD